MIFHIADRFRYILVLSRMPDRRYGEIFWEESAVEGIKGLAIPDRFSLLFEQDVMAFSLRDIEFREVKPPPSFLKLCEIITGAEEHWTLVRDQPDSLHRTGLFNLFTHLGFQRIAEVDFRNAFSGLLDDKVHTGLQICCFDILNPESSCSKVVAVSPH